MSKQIILSTFKLIYLIVFIDNVTAGPRLQSSKNESLNPISIGSSRELSKRQADNCQFNINLHDCKKENLAKTLSTKRTNRFVAIFQSNCIFETKYDWTIIKKDSGEKVLKLLDTTENVLVVEPYTLGAGYHDAVATVHAFKNGLTTTKIAKCEFNVGRDKPIAIIAGGTYRNVEAGQSFIVDGSKSVDTMTPPNKPAHLQFKWLTCKVVKKKIVDQSCRVEHLKEKLENPASMAVKGAEYYFELHLQNPKYPSQLVTTLQYVKIVENVVELEIICEKNCLPAAPKTDSGRETVLRAKCLKNCNGIDENSFKWTVSTPLFDYDKQTSGRYTDKFIIKPGTFTPGMEYLITVDLKSGKAGSVTNTILPHKPPSIESCQVKPPEGTALETKFRVECKYTGDDIFSEIYTVTKNNNKVQIARGMDITSLEFFLPANTKTYIRIVDSDGSFRDHQLTVNVKAAAVADGEDGLQRAIILNERIEKLMQEKNLEEAIQVTNGLMEEMDKKPPKPEHKRIRKDILTNFKKFRIKSKESAIQIASMVNRVVHTNEGESDPYQGELATSLCAQAAKIDLAYLEKEKFPTTFSTDTKENTKTFMECGEVDTKANFEMLKGNPILFGMTTSFPILSLPVINEDYPDYVSDETVLEKREKYEHASENYVDICNTNLKMMALVMVENEDTMIVTTGLSSTQVTRLIGTKLAESTIEAKGAAIQPSDDFNKIAEPVDVMICSWNKDPFWWNLQKRVAITNVVFLKMLKDKKEVVTFTKPNRIILDVSESHKYVNIHEVEVHDIATIRINVRKGDAFFLEFHNLTETFRVMITEFSKPDSDKVQEQGQIVSKKNNNFYHEHNHDHNSWYYITLVPTNKALGKFNFSVSVYSMSCYSWNIAKKEWQFACKGNFNSSEKKLKCYCNHLSILAGMVYNNPIKVEHVLKPDFAMSLIHSYIIFITVCVTFGLYCFVLFLHVFKKGAIGRNVYLPADISSSFLYVYLVKIRTGKRPLSGTSSIICIKLASTKYKSKRHVLNYPDPQKRIFQWGGEDWFVIPTRHYMGMLLEISLWSDYSGRNPSWFCSDVTIYDLQTNQRWFFKLNAWFNLPPNGQVFVTATPSEEENKERLLVTALTRIWPRWSHQAGFSIFKKMAILLSTVLTIFLIAFVMYGLPKLRMNDGFIVVYKYGLYPHVFLIALGSSMASFIFHIPLTWLFKKRIQNGLCWAFLCTNIVLSLSILIVFGFWVPLVTGWLWFTSVIIAIIIYFFILENIYEKVSSILLFKRSDDFELFSNVKSLVLAIEAQRRYLFESFGEDLLRPYFTHLYEPLDEEDIKEKKLQQESRYKLMTLLEDTIMVACYISLLYLAIFANRNVWSVKSHQEILLLTNGVHNRTMNISTIKSIDDFYNYINLSLIPNLQANQWYWKYVIKDPGNMRDFQNKYLGVARLRQQRAKLHDCKVPKIMEFFSKGETCRSEFWTSKRNLDNFGAHLNKSRMTQVWKYTKPKTAGISLVVGKFGVYSGGGFIAPLGRTKYNSMVNLDYLKKRHWLDNATSVVFVEFLTYSVNTNLFNAVRITVERSVTGYFRVVVDIKTAQLLFVRKEDELAGVTIFGSFFLVVFIFTVKILSRLWKGKLLFFKDFWSLIDLSIVAMSYSCFAIYMHRAKLVGQFLEKLDKAKKNQFVNYFNVFYEDLLFVLVAAFLVFVATVRLWKLCRFATVFRIMEKSVLLAFRPIMVICLGQMIFYIAFSFAARMLFGDFVDYFKDIGDTLVTLFLLSMNFYKYLDLDILKDTRPLSWGIFFGCFTVINLLFATIYIANIMICYHEAKVLDSGEDDFSNFRIFLIRELAYYKSLAKVVMARLKGGNDAKEFRLYVIPKPDENRYADCVTINVNNLKIMLRVVIYNLKKDSLEDKQKFQLMHQIVTLRLKDSKEVEFFYGKKTEQNFVKIIRDEKIKIMAKIVQKICSGDIKRRHQVSVAYQKIFVRQQRKLDFVQQMLEAMLRIIQNIEVR